jgi:chromate transport protein ChrA
LRDYIVSILVKHVEYGLHDISKVIVFQSTIINFQKFQSEKQTTAVRTLVMSHMTFYIFSTYHSINVLPFAVEFYTAIQRQSG